MVGGPQLMYTTEVRSVEVRNVLAGLNILQMATWEINSLYI